MAVNKSNKSDLPRILIVSRGVWNENEGTSSTLTSIFSDYDSSKVAHIYTQTLPPNTKCCRHFFQISEIALVKKLFKWRAVTGREVNNGVCLDGNKKDGDSEKKIYSIVRKKRFLIYDILQNILWSFGGWKSKDLKQFIVDFNPDIIWIDGIVSIFMCKLYLYVMKIANKPSILYMMDDNYTYESVSHCRYISRSILRVYTKKLARNCETMFVISSKMKTEFDEIFNRSSIIITKGIDYSNLSFQRYCPHDPIRLLYLGQILYGRIYSLQMLASVLDEVNRNGVKVVLDVYTNTLLSETTKRTLCKKGSITFHTSVPYSQIPSLMQDGDVLLFIESLEKTYSKDARLSFSTKITDYLSSGKCIFAIGPSDSAPIEYFRQEKSALVATSEFEIKQVLSSILDGKSICEYAQAAFDCGRRNHEKSMMQARVITELKKLSKQNIKS